MATQRSATYLYCVVGAAKAPSMTRVPPGVPGASAPESHKVDGSLWLVAAQVPLDVYGPDRLEPNLRDLDWVSRVAIAHEGVVEHFVRARGTTVIPLKLFTMFSSFDKALRDVRSRKKGIDRAMRHIAGAEEWGVRIVRTPAIAAAPPKNASSGTAFLTARKQARDAFANARAASADAAETAFHSLKKHAKDAQLRERRPEPGTNPPILEAAFLVTAGGRAKFRAEARRQTAAVAAAGADLTLSGPWPAYNFVTAAGDRA